MGVMKVKKGSVKEVVETSVEQAVLPQTEQSALGKRFKEIKRKYPGAVAEDASLTSERSNVFLMNNGTKKAILYPDPVNYYDEAEGVWKEIDNSLEEKDECFETKQGKVKTQVKKIPFGKSVRVSKGQKAVEWEYVGNGKRTAKQGALSVKSVAAKKGQAVYEEVEDGVDIVYVMKGNGVKENIVVKKKADEYRYVFKLKTEGLKLRLSEDNEKIELYGDEKVEFVIPSPYMYDASGRRSDEVSYELESDAEGAYAFAVVADKDWINAEETALPVTIDPQIVEEGKELLELCGFYDLKTSSGSYYRYYEGEGVYEIGENGRRKLGKETIDGKERNYGIFLYVHKENVSYWEGQKILAAKVVFEFDQIEGAGTISFLNNNIEYNASSGPLKIDVTDALLAVSDWFSFDVNFSAPSILECNNAYLEIEYACNENVKQTRKQIVLADSVTAEIDYATGEIVNSIVDLSPGQSIMGLSIHHIYKPGMENFYVGKHCFLSLYESFKKHRDDLYIYVDPNGDTYAFNEYHYSLNENGEKEYELVDKDKFTLNADGSLSYYGSKIYKEYKSINGLTAITELDGYNYIDYFESRSDEEKKLEDAIKYYKSILESIALVYVSVDGEPEVKVSLKDYLDSHIAYEEFWTQEEETGYKLSSSGQVVSDAEMPTVKENINSNYKEYVMYKARLKEFWLKNPVNFLTDGKIIKGYNKYGQLVAVFDKYGNQAVIEYENFDVLDIRKTRISRMYDNKNQEVRFVYNAKGVLAAITDIEGKRVSYVYDEEGKLVEVDRDAGARVKLSYQNSYETSYVDKIYRVEEESRATRCDLTWDFENLTIQMYSRASYINADIVYANDLTLLQKIQYAFTKTLVNLTNQLIVTVEDKYREKYVFDEDGNLAEYYREENDVVIAAEKYEYTPVWLGTTQNMDPKYVVKKAKRSSLYLSKLENYTFEDGDVETQLLDQFNNIYQKSTSPIDVGGDECKKITVVDYKYDDNQKLLEEKKTVKYTNPDKSWVGHKVYTYNAMDDVIRIESYIEGEEYSKGKTIQERVFDDKGNLIEEVSYNSLDSSSKYYSQMEYNDVGKVLAKSDESGEEKIDYTYIPGTSLVREKKLPNGSKFAYGYDFDGTLSSITQSTEEGEENSTQKIYCFGELVKLRSGNTVIKYQYQNERRVDKISLNDQDNYLRFTYTKGTNASSSSGGSSSGVAPSGGETIFANYSDGAQIVRIYDKHKNLLEEKVCNVKQLSNTYDAMNRVDTIIDGETNRYYQYTYDDYDRLCMVSETNANGEFIEGNYQEEYTYDIYGKLTKKQINSLGIVYENSYKEDSSHALETIAVSGCAFKPQKDKLGRNSGREIYYSNAKLCEETIYYKKVGDHATMLPSSMYYIGKAGDKSEFVKYAYDKMGNITHIYENGKLLARYEYDALSRLVREDNKALDKTTIWVYDNNGNILKKREFALTFDRKKELEEIDFVDNTYVYDGDKLLSYNGNTCRYNAHGNPTLYREKSVAWRCIKQLVSYDGVTFSYDGFGCRITKNDIKYVYDSANRLIKQYRETVNGVSEEMRFFYDTTGVAGFTYSGAVYLYRKDVQGNVIAIFNSNGEIVARYFYDAWGNHVVVDNSGATIVGTSHIGHLNPFRYRGYYYDTETGLYYLKARYYDPVVGRFISMDDIAYLDSKTINGLNLYAYCGNNPVMRVDSSGNNWWASMWTAIGNWFVDTFSGFVDGTYKVVESVVDYVFFGAEKGLIEEAIEGDSTKPISFFAKYPQNWWDILGWQVGVKINIADFHFSFSIGIGEMNISAGTKENAWDLQVGLNKIGIGHTYTKENLMTPLEDDYLIAYEQWYIRTIPTALLVLGIIYAPQLVPLLVGGAGSLNFAF